MPDEMLNLRRLFRNRFEHYMDTGVHTASVELDGSRLTLLDLCEILKHDLEPFPRHYDSDIVRLCGHEARVWFRDGRSYGDAARLTAKHVSLLREGQHHRTGIWVTTVLKSSGSINAIERHSGYDSDQEIELYYVQAQDEHGPLL